MFNRVEPVFVIIDDFSAFGSNYGFDYTSGSVNQDGKTTNVCLFDYGFLEFQVTDSWYGFGANYHNITNMDKTVEDEIAAIWGQAVSETVSVNFSSNNNSTWIESGSILSSTLYSIGCPIGTLL